MSAQLADTYTPTSGKASEKKKKLFICHTRDLSVKVRSYFFVEEGMQILPVLEEERIGKGEEKVIMCVS